jgi:hypothetical protein
LSYRRSSAGTGLAEARHFSETPSISTGENSAIASLKNGWVEEADVASAVAICTPPTFTECDTSDQIALLEEAMGQQPFSAGIL